MCSSHPTRPVEHVCILLAENHPYFQQLVKDLLGPPFEIVGKVQDERVLLEGAANLKPDVVLTGIDMPILNGLSAMRILFARVLRQVHLGTLPSIELLPT